MSFVQALTMNHGCCVITPAALFFVPRHCDPSQCSFEYKHLGAYQLTQHCSLHRKLRTALHQVYDAGTWQCHNDRSNACRIMPAFGASGAARVQGAVPRRGARHRQQGAQEKMSESATQDVASSPVHMCSRAAWRHDLCQLSLGTRSVSIGINSDGAAAVSKGM